MKQFFSPTAGNLGNVLLTSRNPPKYFYQCTHCSRNIQEKNVRRCIKIFLRNCFTPLWCPEKPKERHRMKKSIRKTTKNRCCLLKKEQEISFGNVVGLVFFSSNSSLVWSIGTMKYLTKVLGNIFLSFFIFNDFPLFLFPNLFWILRFTFFTKFS